MISPKTISFFNSFKLKKPYIPVFNNNNNNNNNNNISSSKFNYKFTLPTNINGLNNFNIYNNESINKNNNNKNHLVYHYQQQQQQKQLQQYKYQSLQNQYNSNQFNKLLIKNRKFTSNNSNKFNDMVRNDGIGIVDLEYENYLRQMEKNMSLQLFLKNTYISTSLGFGGSVLSGLILSHIVSPSSALAASLIGLVGAIGSIWTFNTQSKYARFEEIDAIYENKEKNFVERSIVKVTVPHYPPGMVASYIGLCVSNGLIMSPLLAMTPGIMVAKALVMGAVVTGGSSYFALRMRPDSMQAYRPVLYGSLIGLIGLGLLSMGTHFFFGPNVLTQTVFSIDLYGGLALFTALNMLDTQEAIKEFQETGKPDFLKCSISLVMNTINIFIRLLHIIRNSNDQ